MNDHAKQKASTADKKTALAELLHVQGYSLKVNKKTMEGASHADRDQQFGHINALCKQLEQKQAPAISVDLHPYSMTAL